MEKRDDKKKKEEDTSEGELNEIESFHTARESLETILNYQVYLPPQPQTSPEETKIRNEEAPSGSQTHRISPSRRDNIHQRAEIPKLPKIDSPLLSRDISMARVSDRLTSDSTSFSIPKLDAISAMAERQSPMPSIPSKTPNVYENKKAPETPSASVRKSDTSKKSKFHFFRRPRTSIESKKQRDTLLSARSNVSYNSSIFGEYPTIFNDTERRRSIIWPESGCIHIPLRPSDAESDVEYVSEVLNIDQVDKQIDLVKKEK